MLEKLQYIQEHELRFDERYSLCKDCSECLRDIGECPNKVGE